jgi:hypothetical protein
MSARAVAADSAAPRASRFTFGLICDVFQVLEQHGYQRADDRHTGQAVSLLFRLADVYEGGSEDTP